MPKIIRCTAEVTASQMDGLLWRIPAAAGARGQAGDTVVFAYAHALMAVLLQQIGAVATEAAQQLHDSSGNVRRWALSPLCRDGEEWFFQLAVPNDALAGVVLEALRTAAQPFLLQHPSSPATMRITGAAVTAETTWAQLTAPLAADRWRLSFLTPTAMALPGGHSKLQLPLPLPSALLESWRRVWNQHCPDGCAIAEEVVTAIAAHLAVSSFTGETAMVAIPVAGYQKRFVGFTGQATFTVIDPHQLPPDILTACQALMRFAPYCGTGKKTAWGMGWVQVR